METEHEFIHGVFPRRDLDPRRRDAANLPIASVHLARAERRIVRESGYRTMPYAVSRFHLTPGEVYGRSPALDVLPDIMTVNEMTKTILRGAQKMVNPPLLVPEGDILDGYNLKAGALIYGGLGDDGRPRVLPLQTGGNVPVGRELLQDYHQVINEAFYINLFQILVETPQKTATEVIQRAQEKAQLLAPAMGRQQSELLRVIIERELDIIIHGGALDYVPVPDILLQAGGPAVQPKYETPLAKALDSNDGMAIVQAFQAMAALAQFDPAILEHINYDRAAPVMWRAFGADLGVLRTPEEMAQMRQEKKQQEQMALLLEQAKAAVGGIQGLAGAEKDLAAASANGGGAAGLLGLGLSGEGQ
jgi:hypothetical protein